MNINQLISYSNHMKRVGQKKNANKIMKTIHNMYSNIDIRYLTNVEIVVARYNENLDWLIPYSNITTVYNKGKPLSDKYNFKRVFDIDNVGRESHTYLYHIINHWDELEEKTLFIQGNINDHDNVLPINLYLLSDQPITINLSSIKLDISDWNKPKYNSKWRDIIQNKPWKTSPYNYGQWWDLYIKKEKPHITQFSWSPGGIFSIQKKTIQNNTLNYYKELIKCIDHHVNPEEGHYFERSWFYIFT